MKAEPPRIFVVHPSNMLTDHLGNGDGIAANGFLRGLAARGYEIHVACEDVDLREPLSSNITLYPIRVPRWAKPLGRLIYLFVARRLFDRIHATKPFDLVAQLNPVTVGLSLGMRGCGVPIVLGPYVPRWPQENGPSRFGWIARFLNRLFREAIAAQAQRDAAALLVSSEAALPCIASGISGNRVYAVPFGVPASLLTIEDRSEPQDNLEILFIGGLEARKGLATLLSAFRLLLKERPGVRLRLIGTGSMLGEVQAAADLAPPGSIVIEGHVPSADVPSKIARADVLCAPSNGEPFGIAVVEAMACGKPIVATESGAFPYVVPEAGRILVPPRDPQALASALLQVLDLAHLREAMGMCNRNHVRRHYTWERVLDSLEQVYDQVTDFGFADDVRRAEG